MPGRPMASVAPKARKHLSAEALLRLMQTGCDNIPDYRPAGVNISLSDVLMSAFAMCSAEPPSSFAFDQQHAEDNWHTIYVIPRVPSDTYMRQILDPVSPKSLRPVFTRVLQQLQRGKVLEPLTFLDGHYLL